MRKEFYPVGESYYYNRDRDAYPVYSYYDLRGEHPIRDVPSDPKSTEKFKSLVVSIAQKSIPDIKSQEVNSLIQYLKGRLTGQKGDPEKIFIDAAIQKIREREEMALNKSVYASSKRKHVDNLEFLEEVMAVWSIIGAKRGHTTEDIKKRFIKLCKKISEKSVDQITREEVDQFIHLSLKSGDEIYNNFTYFDDSKGVALTKIYEREKMAHDASNFSKSKMRHENNLIILNQLKGRLRQ